MTLYSQSCQSMELVKRVSYSPLEIQNVQQPDKDTQNTTISFAPSSVSQDASGLTQSPQGMLLATHLISSHLLKALAVKPCRPLSRRFPHLIKSFASQIVLQGPERREPEDPAAVPAPAASAQPAAVSPGFQSYRSADPIPQAVRGRAIPSCPPRLRSPPLHQFISRIRDSDRPTSS